MKITLPWWLTPWAEVRRLRNEQFAKALSHGAEIRTLRGEVEKHIALEERAVHALWEVQSYAATQLRAMRFELGHARQREKLWQEKCLELVNTMPSPVGFIRKEGGS